MSRWSVLRTAVLGLILTALSVIASTAMLLVNDKEVPDGLIALGSVAAGALATLMTTSHLEGGDAPAGTYTKTVEQTTVAKDEAVS